MFDGWSVFKSTGLLGWSWAALRASEGGPGPLPGPPWAVLGRSQGVCGWSWAALRASVGGPGPLSGPLWAILAALGPSVDGPVPSWAEKWPWPRRERDLESGSGPLLGLLCAILGRSWGLCGRPWAALGASVCDLGPLLGSWGLCGGLGPLFGPLWAVLGRSWGLC